jgi:hypothetical protein
MSGARLPTWPVAVWALALAYEKRRKLARAERARRRGLVVIADRWPQDFVDGINDGPLLWQWRDHATGIKRALARWESATYRGAKRVRPDLVVHLRVSTDAAVRRRPDHDADDLAARVEVVDRVVSALPVSSVVRIDADADLDAVCDEALRAVWNIV